MTREERNAMIAANRAAYEASMAAMQAKRFESFKAAISSPSFAYARAKAIGGSMSVLIYCRDKASPTGVVLSGSHDHMGEAVALLDAAGRPFPYSPTEALQSSGALLR